MGLSRRQDWGISEFLVLAGMDVLGNISGTLSPEPSLQGFTESEDSYLRSVIPEPSWGHLSGFVVLWYISLGFSKG